MMRYRTSPKFNMCQFPSIINYYRDQFVDYLFYLRNDQIQDNELVNLEKKYCQYFINITSEIIDELGGQSFILPLTNLEQQDTTKFKKPYSDLLNNTLFALEIFNQFYFKVAIGNRIISNKKKLLIKEIRLSDFDSLLQVFLKAIKHARKIIHPCFSSFLQEDEALTTLFLEKHVKKFIVPSIIAGHSSIATNYSLKKNTLNFISDIKSKLSSCAKNLFNPLFTIAESLGDEKKDFVVVVGDCDGSIIRVICAGLFLEYIEIKKGCLELAISYLIELMNAEAKVIDNLNRKNSWFALLDFQSNEKLQSSLASLIRCLTFKKSKFKLIFIGDIIHDRFSLDKYLTYYVLSEIHKVGVILITGNHDLYQYAVNSDREAPCFIEYITNIRKRIPPSSMHTYYLRNKDFQEFTKDLAGWEMHGSFATKSRQINFKNTYSLFHNAYYLESMNMLFIHNGVCIPSNQTNPAQNLKTAFGNIQFSHSSPFDIKKFVEKINAVHHQKWTLSKNQAQIYEITDFRPSIDEIKTAAKFMSSYGKPVRIISGHNGFFEIQPEVVMLNPRWSKTQDIKTAKFIFTAVKLYKYQYPVIVDLV